MLKRIVDIKNFVIQRALASVYPSIINQSLHLASKERLSFSPNIRPVLFASNILQIGKFIIFTCTYAMCILQGLLIREGRGSNQVELFFS